MKKTPTEIAIEAYEYPLPNEQIASFPLPERDASRLLVYREGVITDHTFRDLAGQLPQNATIVFNDTRVIEARIHFLKSSGARIEIFVLEPFEQSMEQALHNQGSTRWLCLIGGASKWKPGSILQKDLELDGKSIQLTAQYVEKKQESFLINFSWDDSHYNFATILHAAGIIPLPPYIKRVVEEADKERYQTIFSREEGSVAAPTASLHFTDRVFRQLEEKQITKSYVTLHVGAGTFKPVKAATIGDHEMHQEPFTVTRQSLQQLINANKIIAAGTTSMRTLESLYWLGVKANYQADFKSFSLQQWEAYELSEQYPEIDYKESFQALVQLLEQRGEDSLQAFTSLLIAPGYRFHVADGLITNFHQPKSTLLLLIAAFIGDDWKKIYQYALSSGYRFLSYGDSSLLWRREREREKEREED